MTQDIDTSREAVECHNDRARNRILNEALTDLDRIINEHDPDIDTSINNAVWDRLDKMGVELERKAAEALLAERDALRKQVEELTIAEEGVLAAIASECAEVMKLRDQLAAAMDAAQADYERRILSALDMGVNNA